MTVVLEISVLKKQRETEILAMKDNCVMTYGGTCGAKVYRPICLIKEDMREVTRLFEASEEKMDFGKLSNNERNRKISI